MPELKLKNGPAAILFIEQAEKKWKGREVSFQNPESLHPSTFCASR